MDARCFTCLDPVQQSAIQTNLLCQIAQGGGVGGGGVTQGAGDPVAAPASGNGIYYDQTDSSLWAWDSNLSAWVKLLGP